MFLLNSKSIKQYMKKGHLGITPFEEDLLHPTWYYFRLDNLANIWDNQHKEWIHLNLAEKPAAIPPRGYALVRPLEVFRCSKRVLGLFGQASDLPLSGLRLNHSMSIDPGFEGVLEMGLENLLDDPVELHEGDVIGKVCFFDVNDSSPVSDIVPGMLAGATFQHRRNMELRPEAFSSRRRVEARLRG